jgi:ATP-dependent RNA helicase DHX37/DHR1
MSIPSKAFSDTQATTNPINLQSSAKLGTGKTATHREELEKEEHLDVKRLMRKGKKRGRQLGPASDESDDTDDFPEPEAGPSNPRSRPVSPLKALPSLFAPGAIQITTVGSALARDTSGNTVAPRVIKKKKKTKSKVEFIYSVCASFTDFIT